MLTQNQRTELEALGVQNVRIKLVSYGGGRSGDLPGFLSSGGATRGDVEDWLAEKSELELVQQRATLRWAQIAGWAGIASTLLAAAALAYSIWFQK